MPHEKGSPTFAEMRSMSDEQLIGCIDRQFALGPATFHQLLAERYRDELLRREQERHAEVMLRYTEKVHGYTKQMRNLTVLILFATLASLAVAVLAM